MIAFLFLFSCVLIAINALSTNNKVFTKSSVLQPFQQGKALKIISGLNNFNKNLVENVVWAANEGGATHVDIACDAELVKIAKSISSIPICVSSIKPLDFLEAIEAGADMVEIGNFDGFYDQGITFTADDVINMTKETRRLLPDIALSVTIPHTLKLHEQIELAIQLEQCGADIIQTEGKVSSNILGMGVQELIEVSAPTIASAYVLSRSVSIPVLCASGLTDVTVPLALTAGAKGVGIGSMVNKLPNRQQMLLAVSAIASSMGRPVSNKVSDIMNDYHPVDNLNTYKVNEDILSLSK